MSLAHIPRSSSVFPVIAEVRSASDGELALDFRKTYQGGMGMLQEACCRNLMDLYQRVLWSVLDGIWGVSNGSRGCW